MYKRLYLNQHIGFGQVEAGVGHLGHEYRVHLGIVLEVLEDADPLRLGGRPVDVRLVQPDRVVLNKYNHLLGGFSGNFCVF